MIFDLQLWAAYTCASLILEKLFSRSSFYDMVCFSILASGPHSDATITSSVDTGGKLNAHKTFIGRPGRLLNVLCTFNLRPVSAGSENISRSSSIDDTHKEKLFYSIQYKNDWLAASDLFDMFTQLIKFCYHSIIKY